jgi:myosin heavy subunit
VKLPGGMSNKMVVEQLRYSGVLEVVRIRRQGYPVRLKFEKFVKQVSESGVRRKSYCTTPK